MSLLAAIARHLDAMIGPGVMLIYPLYASMKAIENPVTLDEQWLTYWIIHSLITLFELSFWKVLQWIPIWPYVKLLFCLWLVLPGYKGATYVYNNYVHKYAELGSTSSSSAGPGYSDRHRRVVQMMSLDARKSVERYIQEHGPDAFERVIKAAENEARKRAQ